MQCCQQRGLKRREKDKSHSHSQRDSKDKTRDTGYTSPCGICRQVLREFSDADLKVIMAKSVSDYKIMTLAELLPESFGPGNL